MRYVNIRKFHQNMWAEVKDLPLTVTKYGKPYLIIIKHGSGGFPMGGEKK